MTSTQTETITNISISTPCGSHVQNTELAVNYFRAYINPILTVVGVLGNVTALYLFSTHRPWNRFAIYAMALAISDSLVLISNTFLDDFLGRGLYFLTDSKWIIKLDTYSVEACRTMELIGTWFVFTSGSLLVAFSLDRVACMCRPLQCRSNDGIRVALMVSILIAVLGFALSLPQALLYQLVYRPPKMIVDPRLISRDLRNANASQMNVNGELLGSDTYGTDTVTTQFNI
ncbi:hypothetical protein P879_04548 [Paragonimus westermani]|uniref:G-protein coupled receptors family 1 profile domain-containing protein n=1 Tax=Paragonimus westermani TaxID=34504 RepID=A0A8T0DTC2_9TREM|nr:hypothetical protein P879_04548 [Paragonimus westermani]